MKGVKYLVDSSGKKSGVQLDLKIWKDAWEDVQDIMASRQRRKEKKISLSELKSSIKRNAD